MASNASVDMKEAKKLKKSFKKGDVDSAHKFIIAKVNQWKTQPVNIGVIGASGSGKSCFINAIRGLNADDVGAAEVGVTECTKEPTPYPHPESTEIKFWDLPGVGTQSYPKDETYLVKVRVERYDFFLLFSFSRFTENDLWLAKMVAERNKKFFFIRSKIDNDLDGQKRSKPKTFSEEATLATVRDEITTQLTGAGFRKPEVFLISNFEKERWGFPDLCKQLMVQNATYLKREAMTLTLEAVSIKIIEEKKNELRKRIWWMALLACLAEKYPFGSAYDVIKGEALFYKQQFGLDYKCLKKNSTEVSDKQKQLIEEVSHSVSKMVSEGELKTMFGKFYKSASAGFILPVPFLEDIIGAVPIYRSAKEVLEWLLENMEIAARKTFDVYLLP